MSTDDIEEMMNAVRGIVVLIKSLEHSCEVIESWILVDRLAVTRLTLEKEMAKHLALIASAITREHETEEHND